MDTKQNIELVRGYFDALARGDLQGLAHLFSSDVRWYQPGRGSLSGTHQGKAALFALFERFMERSGGTFRIDDVGPIMANGNFVAIILHFSAEKAGTKMAMSGVDVMRIEAGSIREVWLFSADQATEDAFWG